MAKVRSGEVMDSQHKFAKLFQIMLLGILLTLVVAIPLAAQGEEPDQLENGAQIYAENCAVCHGLDGEGRIGATLAQNWPSIRPDLATKATIMAGIPGTVMPAWDQANGGPLTEAEIEAVVRFILSWQTGGAPEITPAATITVHPPIAPIPNVEGDPNQGASLYDFNCKVCHGPEGQGRIGATLTDAWGSIRPDLAIKGTIVQGVPGSAMPAWSQEYGGPLSEDEINHLVAFVMSLPPPAEPSPTSPASPLESRWVGWGGVLLAIFLFAVIAAAFLILQKRTP